MRSLKFGVTWLVLGYFVACAPVQFEKAPEPDDGVEVVEKCEGTSCVQEYTVERTVGRGIVDILIVNDNSGSMSTEQRKMAERFTTFLDSLNGLDFRIAMTTTDVSNRHSSTPQDPSLQSPYRNNGLQDGELIPFGDQKYLSPNLSRSEMDSLFFNTIQRDETDDCEKSGYQSCPSNDERGVFAANLVLRNTANQFMRPTGHLAVVVLSDEDERGISDRRSDLYNGDSSLRSMYPLETNDKPQTFNTEFRRKYPGKTLSVHPIIVVPRTSYGVTPSNSPSDNSCVVTQSSQGTNVRGVEGWTYLQWKESTQGTVGSICSNDYSGILQNIGDFLQKSTVSLPFNCRPVGDQYKVTFDPQPSGQVQVNADFAAMTLNVITPLPPMTKVTLKFDCAK